VAFAQAQAGRFGGLLKGLLAPDRVDACTTALLRHMMDAARDLQVPVRLHMAQGWMEHDAVEPLHGTTAPLWPQRLGVLHDRLAAPHAVLANADDLAAHAAQGVTVAHFPLVLVRRGGGAAVFRAAAADGEPAGHGQRHRPPRHRAEDGCARDGRAHRGRHGRGDRAAGILAPSYPNAVAG
jgi:cytosine/adenosine deaminase-related metal-dependent hydrolase